MLKSLAATLIIPILSTISTIPTMLSADGAALLEKADNIRGPGPDFSFEAEIRPPDGAPIEVAVSVRDNTRGLVRYIRPAKIAGRAILYLDRHMWIYIPGTGRALRISPQQRIHGAISNADIARTTFSADYEVRETQPTERGYVLRLVARTKAAAYHRIDLTVDRSGAPQVAVFFARNGKRKLKTAHFESYRNVLGTSRPTQFRVVDHLDGNTVTIMIYRNFSKSTAPEAWFQPNYLSRL